MKASTIFATVLSVLIAGQIGAVVVAQQENVDESGIFPYEYEMRDLDNGLRVVIVKTDFPNFVSLQIPVQVGSRNEVEPGRTGFAHFFEHMMFRGAGNYSAVEADALYKKAGANRNAWTSDDMTNYHVTLSREDLETALMLEADRFKNIQYAEDEFKVEAGAILGEYNKNVNNPLSKILEVQRNATFSVHTYKHTTMGHLADIIDMPNQFEYSKVFFDRFYRPEKTSLVIVGDLDADDTLSLVEEYWGDWERGDYAADIPQEPAAIEPVYQHVPWPTPVSPWIAIAFRGPAFSDTTNDMVVMNIMHSLAFGSNSPLYSKLVISEEKVINMFPYNPGQKDPYLTTVFANVKEVNDLWYVRDEILRTFADLRLNKVSSIQLSNLKSRIKYGFANGMVNSEAIAETLAHFMGLTRDPESINRVYAMYDRVTADDVLSTANRYFRDGNLVVVSFASSDAAVPDTAIPPGSIDEVVQEMEQDPPEITSVLKQTESPVVDFRILFNAGAADDPKGKEGLAKLTARMITNGGTETHSYEDTQAALFPIAASFGSQVDKEMTVFVGTTHSDNLDVYWEMVSAHILRPSFDEKDFHRIKSEMMNGIENGIKTADDEELGKEVLYEALYKDHPYGHLNSGHIAALESITLDDVRSFYEKQFTRSNLVLGIAGDFPDEFLRRVNIDLNALSASSNASTAAKAALPDPVAPGLGAIIVEKDTKATALSFGFHIDLTRSHPDFPSLWLARSYLGEHRSSNGRLFQRIRELRGINYGDYAYIEYFPNGGRQLQPNPNLSRQQQIFQIWIRPVETVEIAHFSARAAMFELNKMIANGISQEDFEITRTYLIKYADTLAARTQSVDLGYAMDSQYYGIGEFTSHMAAELNKLTREQVNAVIKKYLENMEPTFVFITKDAKELRDRLINEETSVMTYQAEVLAEVLAEDEIIQDLELGLQAEDVTIVPISDIFAGDNDSVKTDVFDTPIASPTIGSTTYPTMSGDMKVQGDPPSSASVHTYSITFLAAFNTILAGFTFLT